VPDAEIAAMGEAAREYVTRQFNDAAIYQRLTRIYKGVLQ
jgi:hypothetical protein